ncbi:unnamed protein product [Nesidiocoris tenuis]|uniref:Uncharacterized protein n=1 Tax=Nesidiocoris tenuis TaxID=355587 RepID=A0A6H5H940_9HEMI|nr:unnamed protein product [Nesidiocoris tenuis]
MSSRSFFHSSSTTTKSVSITTRELCKFCTRVGFKICIGQLVVVELLLDEPSLQCRKKIPNTLFNRANRQECPRFAVLLESPEVCPSRTISPCFRPYRRLMLNVSAASPGKRMACRTITTYPSSWANRARIGKRNRRNLTWLSQATDTCSRAWIWTRNPVSSRYWLGSCRRAMPPRSPSRVITFTLLKSASAA